MSEKRAPQPHLQRRCICCRRSDDQVGLLRFVVLGGVLTWDKERKLPGRGAYVHPTANCWSRMAERKIWEHAFKLGGAAKSEQVAGADIVNAKRLAELMGEVKNAVAELACVDSEVDRSKAGKRVRL